MKSGKQILTFLLLLAFSNGFSQPFTDIAGFNYQRFASDYKDTSDKNTTDTYSFSLLLPKQFKNGNALLFRINAVTMHSERASDALTTSSNLSALSVALGYVGFEIKAMEDYGFCDSKSGVGF